jgi:Protein of unknown function (DUF3568)
MKRSDFPGRALLAAAAWSVSGCLVAAAGGAAGGVYFTSRGVESLVDGTVDQVAARTEAVMRDMKIVFDASSVEKGGDKREFKGKNGDRDVTIELERKSPTTTKVEVTARKNLAEWDKDYAREVLSRIVKKE